jgi:hypothetical protein
MGAKHQKSDTYAIDAFLAFAPWESPQKLQAYKRAIADGFVPGAPVLLELSIKEIKADREKAHATPARKGVAARRAQKR